MAPDKFSALAQVRKLMALANDERGNKAERTNARSQADRIRLKWGISDADLETEAPYEGFDSLSGLGRRFAEGLRQGRERQRRFEVITDAIKAALQSFTQLKPEDRLESIDKLYRHVYHELKGDGRGFDPPRLSEIRDAAILEVYEKHYAARVARREDEDFDDRWDVMQAMEEAKRNTDMRINDIENAIKRAKQARKDRETQAKWRREYEAKQAEEAQ